MEMTDQMQQLAAIGDFVFTQLERMGMHDSCIDGSMILLRVLHSIGFTEARPLTVNVTICNTEFLEWRKTHEMPQSEAELDAFDETDCLFIVIGRKSEVFVEAPEDRWPGHLAVVIPNAAGDRHIVLDLTIVQAERPAIGVFIQPSLFHADDTFLTGKELKAFQRGNLIFRYDAYPDDHSYREEDDSVAEQNWDIAAQQILVLMVQRGLLQRRP